jgi:hypothetical protein
MSSHSEQGPTANPESEEDNMNQNPVLTEALAETFTSAPVFADIAEEIETPQDWAHYLPTIVPAPHIIQPVRVNPPVGMNPVPLRIRVTREETIAVTTDMTKLITNAIKIDGSLKGKVPEAFDRD